MALMYNPDPSNLTIFVIIFRYIITKITPISACNHLLVTHATPRDASVCSRDSRDSSVKFQYAAVIKLLIR